MACSGGAERRRAGWTRRCGLALACAAVCALPQTARAQLPADAAWRTLETTHFRVTFEAHLEPLARHAAAAAERAHAALRVIVGEAPAGTIDVVVSDNVDFSNGYATPFPSNRVVVYAKPPVDVLELQYMHDWIDLVIVHELAHIFHMDVSGAVGRAVRAVFGRVPFPWPVFPAAGTPLWGLEGLAVIVESAVGGLGRVHGSYHEMIVRTAVLEDAMDDIHRLSSTSPVWPGRYRVYIYGSLFMDYIARRFGPDAPARIVRSTAGAILPPSLWFGPVAREALGVPFQQLYADWQRELQQRYTELAARINAEELTTSQPLTAHGRYALYPRFSPDGTSIVYAASDGRMEPRTTVIDAATGAVLWSRARNDVAPHTWTPDGALLTSDLQYLDAFRIFSDAYRVTPDGRSRITRAARLQDMDAARNGAVVAIENAGGTNRIVILDADLEQPRPITIFDPAVHWSLPRWSPDGRRIAVSRWSTGGRYDIVVLDTSGNLLIEVTDSLGINAGSAWSPDGVWLLFSSDRTGIPNLYAAQIGVMGGDSAAAAVDTAGAVVVDTAAAVTAVDTAAIRAVADTVPPGRPRLRQITNVLTGALFPDVAPDGGSIVFAAYHHDGFAIERMPFDPKSWREPQPVGLPVLAYDRGTYPTQVSPVAFAATIETVAASVDTTAARLGPYRALRHMRPYFWLPIIDGAAGDTYLGAWSFGNDLVGRHQWDGSLALAPASGRTVGRVAYSFRGLPPITGTGVHPTLGAAIARDWDEIDRHPTDGWYIDEREDAAALTLALSRIRWRTSSRLALTGEAVRRSRYAFDVPQGATLADPADDLLGLRANASLASYLTPALAISRENGAVLQVGARHRWDRNPTTLEHASGTVTFDAGFTEITTWNAAYLAVPMAGFARHVLAGRFSALHRSGTGAGTTGIGGASGAGFALPSAFGDVGGSSRLLPVRGYPTDARRGTRAWTASAEYRFPLALVSSALAPLPVFVDRIAGSTFFDAGDAWCDDTATARFASCPDPAVSRSPLLSAGAEVTGFLSFWGVGVPVRVGFGVPFEAGRGVRFHLLGGAAF